MALSQRLYDAIVDGKATLAQSTVCEEIEAGADPLALIADTMIPAMDEVASSSKKRSALSRSSCWRGGR
jgi:methanogenic corrinoid protein MtbC1